MDKLNDILALKQSALQSVPGALHLPMVVALVTGVVLLLFGGKVLRSAFIILGGILGAVMGSLLLPNFVADRVFNVPSPLIGLGAGAILGGIMAVSVFRLALGICSAGTLGVLATLIAGVYLSATPGALPQAPTTQAITDAWTSGAKSAAATVISDKASRLKERVTGAASPTQDQAEVDSAAATTRAFLDEIFRAGHDFWNRLPGDSRITLIAALVGGAILGFVMGTVAPVKGAAVLASLLGAGMAVASVAWLVRALDLPGQSLIDQGPRVWLAAWLLPALGGVVFQVARHERRGAVREPEPATAA